MFRERKRGKKYGALPADRVMGTVLSGLGAAEGFALVKLWRNWPEAVGDHIAEVARPLGHRERTLLIGAEDSMVAQELTYYAPQILEDVHAFLGKECFDKVQVDLVMGKAPLDTVGVSLPRTRPATVPDPEQLGELAGKLDEDSPVTRCYEAYVRRYGER